MRRRYRKWQKRTPKRTLLVLTVVMAVVFGIMVIVEVRGLARAKYCGTITRNNTTIITKLVHFGCCLQRTFKVVLKVDESGVTAFS